MTADDGPAPSEDVTEAPAFADGVDPPSLGHRSRYRILGLFAGLIIVVDQITKWWAVERLEGGRTIDLFWTLRFKLHRNTGASFGVGEGLTPIIAVAAMAVSVALVVMARRVNEPRVLLAMGAVLGGALGNVVDRFFRAGDGFLAGGVVDFIDFQWWPIFNVADMGVVLGGITLAWLIQGIESTSGPDGEPDA